MKVLEVDNSTLSATKKCSTLAAARYHLGLSSAEEAAPLRAGTGVHEAVAGYFQSRGDVDAAVRGLATSYKAWAEENVPPDDRLGYPNVEKIVRRWCWAHPLDGLPFVVDPSLVEIGAQALLSEEGQCFACDHDESVHKSAGDACTICPCESFTLCIMQGRLDCVPQGRDGRWYVGDVKTTASIRASWLKNFEMSSQFSGYCWLLEQAVKKPAAGAFVLAIELGLLPGSPKKCSRHKMPYAECSMAHANFTIVHTVREPWMLAEWKRGAQALAKRFMAIQRLVATLDDVQAVRQEGQWIDACATCDLFPWCKSGRSLDIGEAILVKNPWKPFPTT